MRIAWFMLPLLLLAAPLRAESDAAAAEPEWEFSLTPYLWMAGVDGRIDSGSTSTDVDVSFSDLWADLDIGFLGLLEARKGRLSLVSNQMAGPLLGFGYRF